MNKEFELIRISYDELHLMMTRLMIDVIDNPESYADYNSTGEDSIAVFIEGERWRTHLDKPNKDE